MAFPNELQMSLDRQLEDQYNHDIPDNLFHLPQQLIEKFADRKSSANLIQATLLHLKHLQQRRHCFLLSRHHILHLKLLELSTNFKLIMEQNKQLMDQNKLIQQDMAAIKQNTLLQQQGRENAFLNNLTPLDIEQSENSFLYNFDPLSTYQDQADIP